MAGSSVDFNLEFYKISNIVNGWLADNDLPNQWFPKALSLALQEFRELALHDFQEPISVLLVVDARRNAILPQNYVKWTKVGLKIGQYIKTLAVNGEMHHLVRSDNESTVESLPLYNMPNGINFDQYAGYSFYNFNGTTLFGVGGGLPSKGHFEVVKRDNSTYEMTFDYDVREGSEVIMEYIGDGFNPNGETMVNPLCFKYIYSSLDFRYEEKFNPKRTEASIFRMGQKQYDAAFKVRASNNDLDPQTLLMVSRRDTRLTPKV